MKVFISSTFIDMQEERDAINKLIYPIVMRSAKKKGELVTFYDLRWGIPSSDENIVLRTCFDQIDACSPYFVAFLGDRYGWIPDDDLVKNVLKDKNNTFEAEPGISMTQLEIEYAINNAEDADKSKMLFCFRKPINTQDEVYIENFVEQDSKNRLKIEALKNRIRANFSPEQIFEYDAGWDEQQHKIIIPESVQRSIADKIISFLGDRKAREDNWYDRELQEDKFTLSCKGTNFWGRRNELEDCFEFINDDNESICIVKGTAGCGKSSFISKMVFECRDRNIDTVYFFCGNKDYAYSGFNVLKNVIYRLELLCGIEEHYASRQTEDNQRIDINNELREWKKYFTALLEKHAKLNKSLVIFIDGIDQLGDDIIAKRMEWLPYNIPTGVSFIFSHIEDYQCDYIFESMHVIELPLLEEEEIEQVVPFMLKHYGKSVGDTVIEAIRKKQDSKNFLYLSMIVQKLLMFDSNDYHEMNANHNSHKDSNQYFSDMIERMPGRLEDVCIDILDDVGDNYNIELTSEVMNLIAVSRGGLRESDFREIFSQNHMEWRLVDYIYLVNSLPLYVVEREDGFVDFMHRCIREGYQKKLNQGSEGTLQYHTKLFNYISTLNENDKLFQDEMIYHAFFSGESDSIYRFLCDLESSKHNKNTNNAISQLKHILVYQYNQVREAELNGDEQVHTAWLLDIARRMCRENRYSLWVYKLANAFDKKNELLCLAQIMDTCKKELEINLEEADNERLHALAETLCIQAGIDIEFNRDNEGVSNYTKAIKEREKIFTKVLGDTEPRSLELCIKYIDTIMELANYYQKISDDDLAIEKYTEVTHLWGMIEGRCKGQQLVGDIIRESFYRRAYCNYYMGLITKRQRGSGAALKCFKKADQYIWDVASLQKDILNDREMQLRNLNMLEFVNVAYNGRNKEDLISEAQNAFEWFEKAFKLMKNNKKVLDDYLFAYGKIAEFYANFDTAKAMELYDNCLVLSDEREKLYGLSDDIFETIIFLLERGKLAMQKEDGREPAKGYFERAIKKVKHTNVNKKYYSVLRELINCMKKLKMEGIELVESILSAAGPEKESEEKKQGGFGVDLLILNSIAVERKIQQVIKESGLKQQTEEHSEDRTEHHENIRPLHQLISEISESKTAGDNPLQKSLVDITKLNDYFSKANKEDEASKKEEASDKETDKAEEVKAEDIKTEAVKTEEVKSEAAIDTDKVEDKEKSETDALTRRLKQVSLLNPTTRTTPAVQPVNQKQSAESVESDQEKALQLRLRALNEGLKKR